MVLKKFCELQRQEQLKDLTNTGKEVFDLLEQGYTKNMIEAEMYKSQNTVKTEVKKILKKLVVRSSKEVVDKVRTMGLREKLGDG